jgi:hypothetical protein
MKEKKTSLRFNKVNIVELNNSSLLTIIGGVGTNENTNEDTNNTTQTGTLENSSRACEADGGHGI